MEQDAKIDLLYKEKNDDRQRIRELQEEVTRLKLDNHVLKFHECLVKGCTKREPPTGY